MKLINLIPLKKLNLTKTEKKNQGNPYYFQNYFKIPYKVNTKNKKVL
jgi:hypothetical protein